MIALLTRPSTDRWLFASLIALTVATILLAAEAHAFCNLFCIHGMPMIETEICSGRG
ncbi:hypothetical protein [Rhizobium sp. RU36D]|uniref:hypothetical protein n=1 Tax=Rhizobium sp. RU36D TaxID=1907415 RepID=UPI0009D88F93|nr:hypothetical protein [Rhizobium sp. RU36D]SMC72354.1 hypothetical protein SAMN05880593_105145 [Rhizobium sp. RU36D]